MKSPPKSPIFDNCSFLQQSEGDESTSGTIPLSQQLLLPESGNIPTPAVATMQTTSAEKSKFGPLDGATMDDVELVSEAIYPIVKNSRQMTRIKAIKGVAIESVGVKPLDAWATSLGVRISQKQKKKEDVCSLIVDFKILKDRHDAYIAGSGAASNSATAAGTFPTSAMPVATPQTRRVVINYPRLVNTLADETIKAMFVNRGGSLSREDLDDGKKADADLYDAIAATYNNSSLLDLAVLHWEVDWKQEPDPSTFDAISSEKAKTSVATMAAAYDKAYNKWKISGFNEGIERVPFVQFGGGWIYYLHQMLLPFPDLLKAVVAELPEGVFNESGTKQARRKRGRDKGNGGDESMMTMAQAAVQRSNAFEYAALHNASIQTKQEINAAKEGKKKAMKSLKDHSKVGDSGQAKKILKYVASKREEKDEMNQFDEDFPFSQQSINSFDTRVAHANDILDHDIVIKNATQRLSAQEAKMEAKMNNNTTSSNNN